METFKQFLTEKVKFDDRTWGGYIIISDNGERYFKLAIDKNNRNYMHDKWTEILAGETIVITDSMGSAWTINNKKLEFNQQIIKTSAFEIAQIVEFIEGINV